MQVSDDRQITHVADLLYEAAAVEHRWPDALTAAARLLGSDTAHYVVWDKRRGIARSAVTAGHDTKLSARYATEWGPHDPCRAFLEENPGQRWIINTEVMSRDVFARNAYVNEFLIPSGYTYVAKVQVHQVQRGDLYSVFGFVRRAKLGAFDRDWAARAEHWLAPHLPAAARLQCRIAETGVRGRLSEAVIDAMQGGALLVNESGRVLLVNRSAEATLSQPQCGLAIANGMLRARDQGINARLRSALHVGRGTTLRVPGEIGGELMLSIAPLREQVDLAVMNGDRCMIVCLSEPSYRTLDSSIVQALRDLFDLTPGEARTAALVGGGVEPVAVAASEGRSYETVRTVLKRVFHKMGISRQSELVAVIERLKSIVPKS